MATGDTDFDTKAAALVRRRKMAELLQTQALEGFKGPQAGLAKTSIFEPLGQMAKAFAGMHMAGQIDKDEATNEAARESAFKEVMARRPMGTPEIPAVPEGPAIPAVPGQTRAPLASAGEVPMLKDLLETPSVTPPLNELGPVALPLLKPAQPERPGTPAVAAVPAKRPTTDEMLPWAADLARTTQTGKDLAKSVYANMIPKELTPYEIEDMKLKRAQVDATLEEKRVQNMATIALKESELKRLQAKDVQDAGDKAAQRDLMRDIAGMKLEAARAGAGGKEGDYKITTTIDNNGNPLREKKGVHYQVMKDGTISTTPYTGATTPQAVHEKNVEAIRKGNESLDDMKSIYDAVDKDPSIYGKRAQWASHAPKAFGIQGVASGLNETQGGIRTQAAAMTAQYTHSLYGASFSGPEQEKAKSFIINDDDPPTEVKRKLKGRMDLERDHIAKRPVAGQASFTARAGGVPAAGGGGLPPGVTVVD